MDRTRQTLRAGRGYIAVLVLCAAYAVMPQGCDEMALQGRGAGHVGQVQIIRMEAMQ